MTQIIMEDPAASGVKSIKEGLRRLLSWFVDEIRWTCRVFISSADRFYWDNGFSKASALAYATLLSLVPITALLFGVLARSVQQEDHAAGVLEFVFRQFVPGRHIIPDLLPYLQQSSTNLLALNVVAFVTLVFTSLLLINSIEYALNQVWQVYSARPLTDRIAIFCAILILVPVFAISGYYTTSKVEPILAVSSTLNSLYQNALPFLIDFLAFIALYYLVPKAPVRLNSATFGALTAALLFGWAKDSFAWYITGFSSYLSVYGTIASSIPIFLFWLYISWTIVLFGAEVSFQAQYLPRTGKLWKRTLLTTGDGAMLLAVQSLVMVARAFKQGRELPTDLDIAETLGCSSVVLKPTLDALERAGFIMRGDDRRMPITLLKSPELITVADLKEAVFRKRSGLLFGDEMTKFFRAFAKESDPKAVTLSDIIKDG